MVRIEMPGAGDRKALLSFAKTLCDLPADKEYVFDFSNVTFTSPQWMLLTATALRDFKATTPAATRKAVHFEHLTYAAHMGYFQFVGMKFGKAPEEAAGSRTYIPISLQATSLILDRASDSWRHHGDVIEERANKLARVLTQSREGPLFETVSYSVREIVRNVIEHSGAEQFSFAAQYWPTKGSAEIAVHDDGVGITDSLRENPKLRDLTDEEAIAAAVLPGISSKAWRQQKSSDAWANSGYGLYMTRRLCSLGVGEFCILSGNKALSARSNSTQTFDTSLRGTAVTLRLDTTALPDLTDALAEFREEGTREAKAIGGANRKGPSMSSVGLKPKS